MTITHEQAMSMSIPSKPLAYDSQCCDLAIPKPYSFFSLTWAVTLITILSSIVKRGRE
ncbi:hypothetical protein OKW38_000760 [Paraburkholderia sp. MM5496-R1]|uniref:Uncharacterized protein n=1 Tax=Paraburkholderia tuberum TaxID=157910 RepID=A0A1H1KAW3_9BURK|nr:hypothetical protein SAMN05445850_6823 [Paraburkholderia tuberum]